MCEHTHARPHCALRRRISSPEHVWCRGGGGDPILVGMIVKEGVLKKGTPICVQHRGHKDPETGLQVRMRSRRMTMCTVLYYVSHLVLMRVLVAAGIPRYWACHRA